MRITLLDDASSIGGVPVRQASAFLPEDSDLRQLRYDHDANGIEVGRDLIDKTRPSFFKGPLRRTPLDMTPHGTFGKSLTIAQLLDVLPEYWLQTELEVPAEVTPEPPTPRELLDLKRAGDDREKANRPHNRWLASGRDCAGDDREKANRPHNRWLASGRDRDRRERPREQ